MTYACLCWHQWGFSCWLREQIFSKCHVCVNFAALCEMERVPVRELPSSLLPAYLSPMPPGAWRDGKLCLWVSQVGHRVGWKAGIILTWWTRSSGCISAGHICAACCSIPRWVPGAMLLFIMQSLTWVRCLQWTNASQAHPCLIYVNVGLGEISEGR